jgi:hypothetical protein
MSENITKKIKLDLEIDINFDELYGLLYYNFENNNFVKIIKIYETIKNEKISNNIIFITAISMIKLEIYNNCIDILINNNYINDEIIKFNFYNLMNINNTEKLDNNNIIKYYLLAYCYEKKNSIECAIDSYKNTRNFANDMNLENLIKHIDDRLIKNYETDKDKYFDELIELYKHYNMHKKVIELYENKNMISKINEYIKKYIE